MTTPFAKNRVEIQAGQPASSRTKTCVFLMTDSLQVGGSERQFVAVARSLDRDVFDIELGCLQRKGAFLEGLGEISEFPSGGSLYKAGALRARMQLARHLREKEAVLVHSFDFYSNLMLIPAAKLSRVPVVIGSQRQIGDRLTRLQSAVQATAFRMCDRVVCNSRAAAERLIGQGLSEAKVVVIPNGLPEAAFAAAVALPRPPGRIRIAYVARMNDPVKNHSGFLRAAARLAFRFPSVEFVLVGDGPLRPGLEKIAVDLGLGGRAHFLGERRHMEEILASIDISVLFSFSESMSNVVLEAMAAGVPVVATRVGGNSEVIRDRVTGILVEPGDEEDLVKALATLVEQPNLRAKYGECGRRVAQENFRIDHMARRYEALYKSLLEEKKELVRQRRWSSMSTSVSRRPIRVVMVAASRRWIGGQGVQADLLVQNWQSEPEVDVQFIPIDPSLPGCVRWVERIPFLRTLVRTPFYLTSLWRGTKDADIAHIFSASYWSFLLAPMPACLIGLLRGTKILIHYHSGEAQDHLRRSGIALRVLRLADCVVVPSRYLVNVFQEFNLPAQVVPNIVDQGQFSYRPRVPLRPRLVCTRGFHPYYSVDIVVRAFGLIKKEYPGACLCLLGKGPMESQVRKLVTQLGLADVEFVGPVPHKEIGHYYDRNDIFINASWLDNMPVSILEAFASGTPVVTTRPEAVRYLVEHERTGLLSEPGDFEALAGNVFRLLREPNLALDLARHAYEESHCYRWEDVREQWLEAYRSTFPPQSPKDTHHLGIRLERQPLKRIAWRESGKKS